MQRIRTLLRNSFSISKQNQSIMVFASYPVGLPVLSTLAKNYSASALTVVTHYTPPKAKLINEVETLCRDQNIKCYCPIKKNGSAEERNQEWLTFEKEILSEGKQQWPDLGIVCSYGYMIPKHIVSNFKRGILLAHPSLVPKYRGGSPIFHAIANGERESGVSYMEVSPDKFDHGNILYQAKTQLGENQTYEEVERKLSQLAAQNIQHVIDNLESLRPGINQDDIDVSSILAEQLKSPIIKDKQLNFNMPAEKVYNWSRALIIPRVRFQGQQIIVKFQKNILQDAEKKYKAGQLVSVGKKLFLKCSDKLLELKQWQEITKGALPIHTFINRFIGDRKGYKNDLYFE